MIDATRKPFHNQSNGPTKTGGQSASKHKSEAYYQELTEAFKDAAERYRRYCREETIEAALREHGDELEEH